MKKEQLVQLAKNLGIISVDAIEGDHPVNVLEKELIDWASKYEETQRLSMPAEHLAECRETISQLTHENNELRGQLESLQYSSNQELLDKVEENNLIREDTEELTQLREENQQLRDEVERLVTALDEFNPRVMFAKLLSIKMESELSDNVEIKRDNKRYHLSFPKEYYNSKKKECYEWLRNLRDRAKTRDSVERVDLGSHGLVVIAK